MARMRPVTGDWCLVTGDKPCCSEMSSSYPIRSEASAARRSAKNDCSTTQFVIRSKSMVCTSHQSPVTSHQSPVTSHQSPVTSHQSQITIHAVFAVLPGDAPPRKAPFRGKKRGGVERNRWHIV